MEHSGASRILGIHRVSVDNYCYCGNHSLFLLLLSPHPYSLTDIQNKNPYIFLDIRLWFVFYLGLWSLESLLSPGVAEATQSDREQQQGGLPAAL